MARFETRRALEEIGSAGFLSQLRDGDERAYLGLERAFRPMIVGIAGRSGLSRDDAEDVAQETLVALFRCANKISEPAAIAGWIRTTAQREAWKARRRQPVYYLHESDSPSSPDDVDDRLIRQETSSETAAAVQTLGHRDQLVLELTVAADPPTPYVDVAQRLGCAVGSIGAFRGRAIQRLAANLQQSA